MTRRPPAQGSAVAERGVQLGERLAGVRQEDLTVDQQLLEPARRGIAVGLELDTVDVVTAPHVGH